MSNILVVPREYLQPLDLPHVGVQRCVIGHLHSILVDHGMFIDRDQAERDPRYKQIVPYMVVRQPSKVPPLEGQTMPEVLCYVRTKLAGEERLRGKHSIGFGGHVEDHDGHSALLCLSTCMAREIEEELLFPNDVKPSFPEFACLINDDGSDVGQVHLGLLYIIDIREEKPEARLGVTSPDDNIAELKWAKPVTLDTSKFENWSQIVLNNVFKVK